MSTVGVDAEMIEIEVLKCQKCELVEPIPSHCGKPMQIVGDSFVCWKGEHTPCCGKPSVLPVPVHHNKQMVIRRAMAKLMKNGTVFITEVLD